MFPPNLDKAYYVRSPKAGCTAVAAFLIMGYTICLFLLMYYFALDTISDPNPFNESTQSSRIIIAAACLVGTCF